MDMLKSFAVGFGIVFIANKAAKWLQTPNEKGELPVQNKTVQEYALPLAGGVAFVAARKFFGSGTV